MSYIEKNLMNKEQIILKAEPHWIAFISTKLKGFELAITDKRLIGKIGLISATSVDSTLNKVDNVVVSQSLLGKILKVGGIKITTGGQEYLFTGIKNPMEFKRILHEQIDKYESTKLREHAEIIANQANSMR